MRTPSCTVTVGPRSAMRKSQCLDQRLQVDPPAVERNATQHVHLKAKDRGEDSAATTDTQHHDVIRCEAGFSQAFCYVSVYLRGSADREIFLSVLQKCITINQHYKQKQNSPKL